MLVPPNLDYTLESLGPNGRSFVRSGKPFKASDVKRSDVPSNTPLQIEFQAFLTRLFEEIGDGTAPVYMKFSGDRFPMRLDQGRVGHAVANKFLRPLVNGPSGFVDFVELVQIS